VKLPQEREAIGDGRGRKIRTVNTSTGRQGTPYPETEASPKATPHPGYAGDF